MNNQDYFWGTKIITSTPLTEFDAAATQAGVAIDVSHAEAFVASLEVTARATGSVIVKDIQFCDKSDFSGTNISTYTNEYALANDRLSTVAPITQTSLAAVGSRKIAYPNLAKNGQKFARFRFDTVGTVDLSAQLIVAVNYANAPVAE